MRSIQEQFVPTARGGILYDASRGVKPSDELFERAHWAAADALEEVRGGRGSIAILRSGKERWVLRHYRRGGFMAKLLHDQYLWTGARRTRSFAEWRLLASLQRLGLPAPAPIAARYVRSGFLYRADLVTELVPDALTLANAVSGGAPAEETWLRIGATIAAFHRAGVHHADLNAHNILLKEASNGPPVYVLDFDRGRIRARGAWERQVLSRLRRSLDKIASQRAQAVFGDREWRWLIAGYERA